MRTDQVDQELLTVRGLGELDVRLHLEEQRDASGLDGNAAVLLVLASVGQASVASGRRGNDTGSRHQRVGEGRLAVIDVRNHRHVTDVVRLLLDLLQLLDSDCAEQGSGAHQPRQQYRQAESVWQLEAGSSAQLTMAQRFLLWLVRDLQAQTHASVAVEPAGMPGHAVKGNRGGLL